MKPELRSLTGLRGVAASLVMLFHFDLGVIGCGQEGQNPLQRFLGHGYVMVDLFLVLSGYIMAMNYAEMFSHGRAHRAYPVFLLRRIARVYPLFLVLTLAMVGFRLTGLDYPLNLHGLFPGPVAQPVVLNLLMIQAWGLGFSIDPVAWSLSAEWAAYLAFPLLCAATLFGRAWLALLSAVLAVACLVAVASAPDTAMGGMCRHGPLDVSNFTTALPVLRCVASFVLGMAAFRLSALPAVQRAARSAVSGWVLSGAILMLLALPRTDLLLVACFALLVPALAHGRRGAASLLASPVPYALGELSYAIYLLHPYFVGVTGWLLSYGYGHGVAFAFGMADLIGGGVVIAFAYLVHTWVEKPGRRWLRRVEHVVRPALAAPPQSA